jgi:hypothetical protein
MAGTWRARVKRELAAPSRCAAAARPQRRAAGRQDGGAVRWRVWRARGIVSPSEIPTSLLSARARAGTARVDRRRGIEAPGSVYRIAMSSKARRRGGLQDTGVAQLDSSHPRRPRHRAGERKGCARTWVDKGAGSVWCGCLMSATTGRGHVTTRASLSVRGEPSVSKSAEERPGSTMEAV